MCFCLRNILMLRVHSCMHVPAMVYLKYEVIIGLHVWMYMFVTDCKSEWEPACVCVGEKDSGRSEGVCHLESQWITVPASTQWSGSWTYQLAKCVCHCVRTCTHKGANWPLWACLSSHSEIGFHYGVNEPIKLIANRKQDLSPQTANRKSLPIGAESTNNVLTQKAMCYLDDTIYKIAYAKMTVACAEYHIRK